MCAKRTCSGRFAVVASGALDTLMSYLLFLRATCLIVEKKKEGKKNLSQKNLLAKMQEVARSRGQRCGDIELPGYFAKAAGPVPLVLDLRIVLF